ncbi:MAG: FKBP-type peptidyl-prolyl cis-trans isomerase [Bacteroidia bacterium]
MKRILLVLMVLGCGLLGQAQVTHEGEAQERLKVGRHVWKDASGQIKAEVVHDAKGMVVSFRTWDNKGLLIDEIKLDPKRDRKELPAMDMVYEEDGFGFVLIQGQATADAPKPIAGDKVGVFYEGYLQDGTIFDGNMSGKKPFRYKFANNEVVEGFDRAVGLLQVGEEGYFWLPASMAYGENVAGEIPPFSDLLFKIRLVDLN